jgi:hypothetical protein
VTLSAVLTIEVAASVVLLVVVLTIAAAKGFTIGDLCRLAWGANKRFWRGDRDWSRHGDEDRHPRRASDD